MDIYDCSVDEKIASVWNHMLMTVHEKKHLLFGNLLKLKIVQSIGKQNRLKGQIPREIG